MRTPPLRDRLQDAAALAEHFAELASVRLTGVPLRPTETETAPLLSYAWPGNVRELAAVVECAAVLGGGRRLDLAAALGGARRAPARPELLGPDPHTLRGKMRWLEIDGARFRHRATRP